MIYSHSDYFDGEYAPVWKEDHTGMQQLNLGAHSHIAKIYESEICRDFCTTEM